MNSATPPSGTRSGPRAAAAVATPVCDRLLPGSQGVVLGSTSRAAWLELGDFVVAIMPGGMPLMPNAVAVGRALHTTRFRPGARVRAGTDSLDAGDVTVDLAAATRWSPLAPSNEGYGPRDVRGRARQLLAAPPPPEPSAAVPHLAASTRVARDARGNDGVRRLLLAAEQRDAGLASDAADLLVGRGRGLTPEGDDLLAAAAAAGASLGAAVGFDDPDRRTWTEALCPPCVRQRTTALSATLLRLAAEGMVLEPVRAVLDLSRSPGRCRGDTARLRSVGHGTGRTYALGLGCIAALLAR